MATMTDDAYVYQVPVMTGVVGFESADSTGSFIGNWPKDAVLAHSAEDGVMDETPPSLTHDIETDQLPPAVSPLIGPCRLPGRVVAKCDGGKVTHEHVYWDHASLPVQWAARPGRAAAPGAQADNLLNLRALPTV